MKLDLPLFMKVLSEGCADPVSRRRAVGIKTESKGADAVQMDIWFSHLFSKTDL